MNLESGKYFLSRHWIPFNMLSLNIHKYQTKYIDQLKSNLPILCLDLHIVLTAFLEAALMVRPMYMEPPVAANRTQPGYFWFNVVVFLYSLKSSLLLHWQVGNHTDIKNYISNRVKLHL